MKQIVTGLLVSCLAAVALADGDALFKQGASLFGTEPEKAFPLFVAAAEEGHVSAMVGAAHCLENGIGTERDYAQAITWYEKAVEQNNLKACEALARIYASCPVPQFHDGEMAVKYAGALVRKNPRDAGFLAVLAAAHARNAEFDAALQAMAKAIRYENKASELVELQRTRQHYQDGEPYPPIAGDAWLQQAAKQNSIWAIRELAFRSANRLDSSLDGRQILTLYEKGIGTDDLELLVFFGKLYLEAGEFMKAYEVFQSARDSWEKLGGRKYAYPTEVAKRDYLNTTADKAYEDALAFLKGKEEVRMFGTYDSWAIIPGMPGGPVADMIDVPVNMSYRSKEQAMTAQRKWDGHSTHFTYETRTSEEIRKYSIEVRLVKVAPDRLGYYYLLQIAAGKGHAAAKKALEPLLENSRQCQALIRNDPAHEPGFQAKQLEDEAVRQCSGQELPPNPELSGYLLLQSFYLTQSPRTACMLGMLNLRDGMSAQSFVLRHPDRGIDWLEMARAEGYEPATRRLIELYACDEDPDLWNAKLAIEYAEELLKSTPVDDHDALQLLACAHAREGNYSKAASFMEKALDERDKAGGDLTREYELKLRAFRGKKEPWTWRRASMAKGFAEAVQRLGAP